MAATVKIYNSFLEDCNQDYVFYYTGKSNVLGLANPDYIYNNIANYKLARIAFYISDENTDLNQLIYLNETVRCVMINTTEDNISLSKSFIIHLESVIKNGRVVPNSSNCTITCDSIDKSDINVIITEDSYNNDSIEGYGIGLWVNVTDCKYVLTEVISSLAMNSCPMNAEHYISNYKSEYLTDNTAINDINVSNMDALIANNSICEPKISSSFIEARLDKLEEVTKFTPQFIQNSVIYDNTYRPSVSNMEEYIQPLSIRGETLDRILTLDPINKGFKVNKSGMYALQLKQGFYLNEGESGLDLIVYKNSDVIKEMGISCYLTSKENGVIKNLYSSNVYIVQLSTDDIISLKAMWTDITDLSTENETMISVTYLIGTE